jgi:hypothetical protein
VTTSTGPKVDFYIDGVLVLAAQDLYSGGLVFNVIKSGSVTIPTSGYHHLLMKVNGRNASSTDYVVTYTKIFLVPTAF